ASGARGQERAETATRRPLGRSFSDVTQAVPAPSEEEPEASGSFSFSEPEKPPPAAPEPDVPRRRMAEKQDAVAAGAGLRDGMEDGKPIDAVTLARVVRPQHVPPDIAERGALPSSLPAQPPTFRRLVESARSGATGRLDADGR